METINVEKLKELAKPLIGYGENIEYARGICELIADVDGREDVSHSVRARVIQCDLIGGNEDLLDMLNSLRELELEDRLSSEDGEVYLHIYEILTERKVEIPFGIEI